MDEPFTRAANNIMPAATTDVMDALAGSLNNLALAATSNKTTLQQLTAANLALTTTVAMLTVATRSSPKGWLNSTYHPTYVVVTRDVVVKVLNAMHPEPSGAITVGHTDTRPHTLESPA